MVEQVIFDERATCLVVEIIDSNQDQQFILHKVGARSSIFAKCSSCQEPGQLDIHCRCNKVFYCSKDCQTKDLVFHEERCQGLEVLDEWDQSCQPKQDARMGLTGIRNLTNSCYLSSSL